MKDLGFRTNCVDGISPEMIDAIIDASIGVEVSQAGGNNACKIVDYNGQQYAVLKTGNIECYNFNNTTDKNHNMSKEEIMDTGAFNFDEVMRIAFQKQQYHAVPILGFSWDTQKVLEYTSCAYARGFIVQPKAPGKELYGGARDMYKYKSEEVQKFIDYTKKYSNIPPKHFADFITNYIEIAKDLAVDPSKRGNFFYDEQKGFFFIDLNFRQNQDKTQEEIVEESVSNSIIQFRTVYGGIFEGFSTDEKAEYAKANKQIFENIITGYTMAGIDQDMLVESIDSHVKDNKVFNAAGVESAKQLVSATLSKMQDDSAQ